MVPTRSACEQTERRRESCRRKRANQRLNNPEQLLAANDRYRYKLIDKQERNGHSTARWTETEWETAKVLRREGLSLRQIGFVLNKSFSAVQMRFLREKWRARDAKALEG